MIRLARTYTANPFSCAPPAALSSSVHDVTLPKRGGGLNGEVLLVGDAYDVCCVSQNKSRDENGLCVRSVTRCEARPAVHSHFKELAPS